MPARIINKSLAVKAMERAAIGTLIAMLFMFSTSVTSKENDSVGDVAIARLFATESPLTVTIEAPLTTLMNERPEEEYLEGTFRFTEVDGTARTLDLKLRTRGNYRREEKHCNFTPIRLNFRESQVVGTEFDGQDKLKMVTHCRSRNWRYEQLLLREYLAYRILNVMTTKSFAVRLLHVNYVDTEGGKPMTKLGFLIEDDDDVAERNGMIVIRSGHISNDKLDRKHQNLVHVFQYLIGNTEYSLFRAEPGKDCCHNVDLISATSDGPFTPLAYDFDFAGIVNAHYAQPNPRYKLDDVRQRLFKGRCENVDLLPDTFQRFQDRKEAIYGLVEELEGLNLRYRREITRYLNSFYDHIAKPRSVKNRFLKRCVDSP